MESGSKKPCCACNPENHERRGFFKQALCVIIGGIISVVPFAAGITFFVDPLRRKSNGGGTGSPIRVTSLNALPNDGLPRKFPVIADRSDAWNKYANVPVGAVYLRRTSETEVQAFNVVCPHAGCFVDFVAERKSYLCPCHNSTFGLDGGINDPKSPSPRGMDPLEVQIRGNEVFVVFQNFRAGTHERIPEA
jgi:menaquinol-cytochrome c reductase iron-sulfur subunit